MQRINSNTVELTGAEIQVLNLFEEQTARGLGIQAAALEAVRLYSADHPMWHKYVSRRMKHPLRSAAFIHYLSDGTLRLADGEVVPQ